MKIAIIQLGFIGDIAGILPLAKHLHDEGHDVDWYVSADFSAILEGVSYVNVKELTIGYADVEGAIERVNRSGIVYDKILVTQVNGNPSIRHDCKNFSTQSWSFAGAEYLTLYHDLPLVFDRRNRAEEQKWVERFMPDKPGDERPWLCYSLLGRSSPHPDVDSIQGWIKQNFGEDFKQLNLAAIPFQAPHHMLGVLEKAAALISIDTATLHIAYATKTPTIALQPDDPWKRSERRKHWVEAVTYSESMTEEGRAKIKAAMIRPQRKVNVLKKMKAPGDVRPGIWRGRILQIKVTNACDLDCKNCSVAVGIAKKLKRQFRMTPDQFRTALQSLRGYPGVIGMFGGNPTIHPQFEELCAIIREEIPNKEQRGLWSNNLRGHGKVCRETFHGPHSNLNVHQVQSAWDEIVRDWPEARPIPAGLSEPSTHGPIFGSMTELGLSEAEMWNKVSSCYVNQTWSSEITVIDEKLVGFFCEIAATMAELTGDASLGLPVEEGWWLQPMTAFEHQVNAYCTKCLIPMNGRKIDAAGKEPEEFTKAWAPVMLSIKNRPMKQIERAEEIAGGRPATEYLSKGVGNFPAMAGAK